MSFSSYVNKRLIDLLDDRRIVVWYDADGDFTEFSCAFKAPNCEVLSAGESVLKTRRRADEVYRLMNESEKASEAQRNLLIYIPHARGTREEERMQDPFEVYALAGAPFGDTEDQKLESLARQALPKKAEEISRLFKEGRPTIALLDGLDKTQRYPVVHQVLRTESPTEVIAVALCDSEKSNDIEAATGCLEELRRLLEASVGFKPPARVKAWKSIREHLGAYVLFSEFVLDLPCEAPDSLSAVSRAAVEAKETIFAVCDRMRSDTNLCEAYIELAGKVESNLNLADMTEDISAPGERDTFPFEERRLLRQLVEHAAKGELDMVHAILEGRKRSIWRNDPERSVLWSVAERGTALLGSVDAVRGAASPKNLKGAVEAYVSGGVADLDRDQRLLEAGIAACVDDDEILPLIDLCRKQYREAALEVQEKFLELVQNEGWPPEGVKRQTRIFDEHVEPALEKREKTAYFLVDSLRYEMGRDLGAALEPLGQVQCHAVASVLPTVTDSGMAALMPKADGMLRLEENDGDLIPVIGSRLVKGSTERMQLLKDLYGDRFDEMTLDKLLSRPRKLSERLADIGLLVVRTQDPDKIGEELGGHLARKILTSTIGDITSAVKLVVEAGFRRIVIAADHGHVMLPDIPPGDVVKEPSGEWIGAKRRCRLGKGLSKGQGTLAFKAGHVGIQGDVEEICVPTGFKVFSDGEAYFHGGLSLQEAVIPVVVLNAAEAKGVAGGKPVISLQYRSSKFTSRVIGLKLYFQGDLLATAIRVSIEAYDGTTTKAEQVGEAADCEARDEKTHEVALEPNQETPVPVLIDGDFEGPEVEIRVSDPKTRVVWARLKLKNDMME